jgi:hypothetical protein
MLKTAVITPEPLHQPGPVLARGAFLIPVGLVAGFVVLWGILFLAIPPGQQDFPLNDDWAFARGAFDFARGDGIHYSRWSSMPQLGQWLWSWPFIQVFGESHAALRFSTIVLALLGILAFFDLLRQAGLAPGRAAFVAACLALNPLFFELSGTFLTDVPALAFSLIALALYGRALSLASTSLLRAVDFLALAVVVALLGAISRQNTITVPMAAGLILLAYPRIRYRPAWLLSIVVPACAAVAAHYWLKSRPDHYALLPKGGVDLGRLLLLAFTITQYMGLAALPVLLFEADVSSWRQPRVWVGFFAVLILLAGGAVFYGLGLDQEGPLRAWWNGWAKEGFWALFNERSTVGDTFPYLTNMLTPWGQFGVNEIVMGERPELLGPAVRLALSAAGCVAGAALLVRAAARLRAGAWKQLLTIFTILHLPFLIMPFVIFDRYYVVFMPGAIYLATNPRADAAPVAEQSYRWRRVLGLAALVVFGLFSVALLHDWLAWNSARWTLGRRALERGIAARDIEGGFEWDSWYAPAPPYLNPPEKESDLLLPYTNVMYGHISGRFALSFSVPEDATVSDRETYASWLPPGKREFYLVERQKRKSSPP